MACQSGPERDAVRRNVLGRYCTTAIPNEKSTRSRTRPAGLRRSACQFNPVQDPFLGKEVPDDHQPDHAANRRISILRPHDGGDGADRRPAWEVAEESGGGETTPDSPELIERRPTHREVACDGRDTGGCRDHSCGTLDSNPRGGGPAASAGRSVPVDSSTTGAERESIDHPLERIFSPANTKTPQTLMASAGSMFFRAETPRVRERSSPATTASQSSETEQCDGTGLRHRRSERTRGTTRRRPRPGKPGRPLAGLTQRYKKEAALIKIAPDQGGRGRGNLLPSYSLRTPGTRKSTAQRRNEG